MKVFISGLTTNVNQPSLRKLADGLLKGPWYRFATTKVDMTHCSIYQMTDLDTGRSEIAAILDIASTRQAWELIEKLEGYKLDGYTLHAHKWFPRTQAADRRTEDIKLSTNVGPIPATNDRRSGRDRRRNLKIHRPNKVHFKAVSGFERSYGT